MLTARTDRIAMNPMRRVVQCHSPRHLYHRPFRSTVCDRTRHAYEPNNGRGIDDPASIAAGMYFLLEHLPPCVLAAQEDASRIHEHSLIEGIVVRLVHRFGSTDGFEAYAGIVDHAACFHQRPGFYLRKGVSPTCLASHIPKRLLRSRLVCSGYR